LGVVEEGLSPREIQIQSGHRDISTLLGYIQHTPSRIRKSYESVFNDIEAEPITSDRKKLSVEKNPDYYKKLAFEKYLHGEIDTEELNSLLNTLESKKDDKDKPSDVAYR
jgi:hypothetical protein